MPTNEKLNEKDTQKMYDKEVARFAKRIAVAYNSDKIRLVTSRNVRRAVLLHDIDAINDIIKDIPNMPDGFRSDFCDAFIGEDMSGLDLATPAILGYAYSAISTRVKNGDKSQQVRLNKLAKRIDDLSADFANSGGMVVRQNEWPLINMSNIANENEDFAIMLDARMADASGEKKEEIKANSDYAKKIAKDYDEAWNLDKLKPTDVDKLSERWNKIYKFLDRSGIHDDTREKFIKCKMLDSKGRVIPQFSDKDGTEHEEYEKGFEILEDSRYEAIIELVKHDIAKRYVADVNAKIDKVTIENEFNAELLIKLYEIYAADQIAQGATETPEQFATPEFLENFKKMLEPDGDGVTISDNGYNVAIETQTDATVGWFARLRNKVGGDGKNLKKLWKEMNRSLEYVDDMADVRMSRAAVERRKKRREFAGRIITGFGSSFIASALVTVGATAAAAKAGKSLAWGSVFVGGGLALGMIAFQVARWIRNQKKNNLPVSMEEFKKNKQLVRSLITSGLAIVAMGFGAAGLGGIAMGVGIGAALLGAYNNGVGVFKSARDAKMSPIQSIAWAIANAGSVIAGALGGKSFAQWGIGKYNQWNPGNKWFNNKIAVPGEQKKISDEITHERTIMHYSDDMLQNSKNIVEGWYAHDYPNHPEILQQDIDAVNQYNLDNDANLDPYRILRAIKMSQPSRLTYTPGWADANGVPQELIDLASHAVDGGTYNSMGIRAASYLDTHYLGNQGEVGPVGEFTNRTYSPITELPTETTKTIVDQPARYEPTFEAKPEPVDIRAGYGAFGNYTPRERKSNLRNRIGSFLDRVHSNRRNEPVTEDVPQFISNDGREIPTFTLDEPQEQQLPPVILDKQGEELRPTGENTPSPARRKEYVAPVVNLSQTQQVPDLRLKDMPVALPDPESRKYEPYYDFALTEAQAEHLHDLHEQLATVRAEISEARKVTNKFTKKVLKLEEQARRLINEINSFNKELGDPSTDNFERALAEIERRKELRPLLDDYEQHKAKGAGATGFGFHEWVREEGKLQQKIAKLGDRDSLKELPFIETKFDKLQALLKEYKNHMDNEPIGWEKSRWNEKRERLLNEIAKFNNITLDEKDSKFVADELNWLKEQKQKSVQKKPGESVQQKATKIKSTGNKVYAELMKIRGVPVNLLDLTGSGSPFTQNEGRVMVVVDVDGLRIPFFLANGKEPGNVIRSGKWYPLFDVAKDGRWFFKGTLNYEAKQQSEEINLIASQLNVNIGDVRSRMPQIDNVNSEEVFNLVDHQPNRDYSDVYTLFWTGEDPINSDLDFVARYLRSVKAPDYVEESNWPGLLRGLFKKDQKDRNRFFLGMNRFVNRVQGGFLGGNGNPNERE